MFLAWHHLPSVAAAGAVAAVGSAAVAGAAADVEPRLILTDSSPSLISISAMSEDSNNSISFFTFLMSIGISGYRVLVSEFFTSSLKRQFITLGAQANHASDSDVGKIGMMPVRFSAEQV